MGASSALATSGNRASTALICLSGSMTIRCLHPQDDSAHPYPALCSARGRPRKQRWHNCPPGEPPRTVDSARRREVSYRRMPQRSLVAVARQVMTLTTSPASAELARKRPERACYARDEDVILATNNATFGDCMRCKCCMPGFHSFPPLVGIDNGAFSGRARRTRAIGEPVTRVLEIDLDGDDVPFCNRIAAAKPLLLLKLRLKLPMLRSGPHRHRRTARSR